MLAEVGQNQEQSNSIELLVELLGHAWPCKTKSGSSRGGTFVTATSAPVASQGTLDVSFQLVGRAWCGYQCESHLRIASCSPSNPECESSC